MSRRTTRQAALDFLAAQDPDTLWTVAAIERATGIDRYDLSSALCEASDEGVVDRYPGADTRPAAYAMGLDQRARRPQ